ncbi:MAG: DUF6765 family protein, partial [Nitrospinota bacterium]
MQIDFHHAVTYITARAAGFDQKSAKIIAHSAQYVDDATSSSPIYFDNKALYTRISSAHPLIDYKNLQQVENHEVWLPFHFLPGNGNLPAGENPDGKFIKKIVCLPDSPVAQDMVRMAILHQDSKYALHRLGVTMHVYADTWAHQGFAGVLHPVNDLEDATEENENDSSFGSNLFSFLCDVVDEFIPPLGHGKASALPDLPFLKWSYKNGKNELIRRDNPEDFLTAANQMCCAMKKFIGKDPDLVVTGLKTEDLYVLQELFTTLTSKDEKKRHQAYLDAVRQGRFSFGPEEISYFLGNRKGSWKAEA